MIYLIASQAIIISLVTLSSDLIAKEINSVSSWLLFRGNPQQDGFLPTSIKGPFEIQWKISLKDSIEGTAVVHNGKVYFGCMDEKVYALDCKDGKEIWKYKGGSFKAPPSIQDEVIYIGDIDGSLHAIDLNTGIKKWAFATNGEISGGANFFKKNILFGSQDENLYCLNAAGKELWKFKMEGPFFGSCAIIEGKTFAAGCDSTLHVLDAETGKELSNLDLGGQTGATPSIAGDDLFVGTMSNNVLGINWKKPKINWNYKPEKRSQPFFSSCAIAKNLVVVGGRDKKIHAIDREKGMEIWGVQTDGKVDASPLILGNTVVAGSFDGYLYFLNLEDGKLIQKLNLGGEISGSPVFYENSIYLGTSKGDFFRLKPKE
jgi:outer membrane protein assembly factor BamB